MALFSFYNLRKPRQYDHKPIYWDPKREALEERILKVKRKMGEEPQPEEYKPQIKGTFIEGTSHLKKSIIGRGDTIRSRNGRIMKYILAGTILVVIFWYMFMS